MKRKLFTLILLLCASVSLKAQCNFSLSTNMQQVDVSCYGGNDGYIGLNPSGGTSPYSFQLNQLTPQTSNSFSNLTAGTYTVYVTDANLCLDSIVVSISEPTPLTTVLTSVVNPSCGNACNGSITTMSAGGMPPYAYTITPNFSNCGNPLINNGAFTNLSAGTYTIVVIDGNGCTGTNVTSLSSPPPISLNVVSTTAASCIPGCDGTVTLASSGGVGAIAYTVTPNTFGNIVGNTISGLCASVNYTVTASDANGCTVTTALFVPNSPGPIINSISMTQLPSCVPGCDGSAVMSSIGVPLVYTISPNATIIGNNITGLCANTTYGIIASDMNGCTSNYILQVPSSGITTNYSSTNIFCNGMNNGTITVNNSSGGVAPYNYLVNNAPMPSNPMTGLSAGIYTLTSTDVNGCSQTNYITITSPVPMFLSLNGDYVTCGVHSPIQTIGTGGTPPYNFQIQPMNVSNTTGVFYPNAIGTYTVTATDANGCTVSATNTSNVISSALIGVTVSSQDYDETCNQSGDGSINVTANPNAGLSYSWSNGATTEDLTNVVNGAYTVTISNATGDCLNHVDTIGIAGTNCGTITGKVYVDSLIDCTFNSGDYGIPNRQITLSTGDLTLTDAAGFYQFLNVPFGSHTLSETGSTNYLPNTCAQASAVTLSSTSPLSSNNDFKKDSNPLIDEYIYLIGTRYVPGIAPTWVGAYIKLEVVNNNPVAVNNKVTLVLNDSLNFAYSVPAPASITPTPNGDSLTWFVTNPPFSQWYNSSTNEIIVYINTPTNLTLGSALTSCATLTSTNATDNNMVNNSTCITKLVATSFDPNDKSVQPEGQGPQGKITLNDKQLDYKIRFQNTGTAPAHNIYIMDTLSNLLDINTLEVLGASHTYQLEILDNHIIKFKFSNIMLPDSGTDLQGSNGYIMYRIQQKNNNQIGDIINNTAAIYFDFNAPIITNTTVNTISTPLSVENIVLKSQLIYPNPSEGIFYFKNNDFEGSLKQVYNSLGQMVYSTNDKQINLSKQPNGMYTLRIKQGKQWFSEVLLKK